MIKINACQPTLIWHYEFYFSSISDRFCAPLSKMQCVLQLLLMPMLAPSVGEEKLLSIGLLASCTHVIFFCAIYTLILCYIAFFLIDGLGRNKNLCDWYGILWMQIFLYSIAWASWVVLSTFTANVFYIIMEHIYLILLLILMRFSMLLFMKYIFFS